MGLEVCPYNLSWIILSDRCITGYSITIAHAVIVYRLLFFRYIIKKWVRVFEACLVAACSAIILVFLIYAVPVCSPIRGFVPPSNSSEQLAINDTLSHPASHNVHRRSAAPSGGEHANPADGSTNDSEQLNANHEGAPHGAHGDPHGDPYGNHGHGYVFRVSKLDCHAFMHHANPSGLYQP